MINEVFTTDIETRLRMAESLQLLRLFEAARAPGRPATIGLLSSDVMKAFGPHLVVLERAEGDELVFLYAGPHVPDDLGRPVAARSTARIEKGTAELYRLGCTWAARRGEAVCIDHLSGPGHRVHRWECLFLPMQDASGQPVFAALCVPREGKGEYLSTLMDASPEAMIASVPKRDEAGDIVDATIIYANRRAVELAGGADGAEIVGTSMLQLFEGSDDGGWRDRQLVVMRSGKPAHFEFLQRSQQASRWLCFRSLPVQDGVLICFNDITAQKSAQLELEHQKKILTDEMHQRRGLEQELWALAHLDPLTGLANRRAFREAATLKLAESLTTHRPLALISLDIDHFKRVNDAHGHAAGDTVLRRIADILKAPLRLNTDVAARTGGEEFTIILVDTDIDAALAFAEQLRRRIAQTMVVIDGCEIRPTVSLGVAMNRKDSSLDDLIERSDRALYSAKRTGRNKVCAESAATIPKPASLQDQDQAA